MAGVTIGLLSTIIRFIVLRDVQNQYDRRRQMSFASVPGKAATGGATHVGSVTITLPMSRLGSASPLPRFRWQQPIPDRETPPSRGLNAEESINAFDWGKDSI